MTTTTLVSLEQSFSESVNELRNQLYLIHNTIGDALSTKNDESNGSPGQHCSKRTDETITTAETLRELQSQMDEAMRLFRSHATLVQTSLAANGATVTGQQQQRQQHRTGRKAWETNNIHNGQSSRLDSENGGREQSMKPFREKFDKLIENESTDDPVKTTLPNVQLKHPALPITLKRLDHYTLICGDAKKVAEFHTKVLNFELDSIKTINTGTVKKGEHDMLNYILRPPGNKDMVMVVTEGLNDETVFQKYMNAHGAGVHHFAFEVDDLDAAFAAVKKAGIQTTSERVTADMLSGLKQFFIAPSHAGFFIELIERPRSCTADECHQEEDVNMHDAITDRRDLFTRNNMRELAQSISKFVTNANESRSHLLENIHLDNEEGNNMDVSGEREVLHLMSGISLGKISAFEIAVENISSSISFLVETLNFRYIRHHGKNVCLGLPGVHQNTSIVLRQASSSIEERMAMAMFEVPDLTCNKANELSESRIFKTGDNSIILSDSYTTYEVLLAPPDILSKKNKIVQSDMLGIELTVHIKADKLKLMRFLSDASNLPVWTVHRAIHYSSNEQSWVEMRTSSCGVLTSFIVEVERKEDSKICVRWPQRNVEVTFLCTEIGPGFCSISVTLPSARGEKELAKMKRIVTIELELLKAIMENNVHEVIPDRYHHDIEAYHLSMYGGEVKHEIPVDFSWQAFGFQGGVVTSGPMFDKMSTDFALTIWSQPQAILRPTSAEDIKAAVRIASAYNIPLAARGSQVSHSAGGQAQSDGGLLVDMSLISSVDLIRNGNEPVAVRTGTGAFWDEIIRQTLRFGLMPPVVNDYQYLSVGGTISMGGVGFMSHQFGIQAAHVNEMEVVTGQGEFLVCSPDDNKDLFDLARGGLGQCGIITSVTIPLVKAPTAISTLKLFYLAANVQEFSEDVKAFVESSQIEMIHAFVKPCTESSITKIIGFDAFASSSSMFRAIVGKGESEGGLLFFLELGCYKWGDELGDTTRLNDIKESLLSKSRCIDGKYFADESDFQTYIMKDPPVVETNKVHGTVPHPSFATIVGEDGVVALLESHIGSSERGEDSSNEILIMPVKNNSTLPTGHHVPIFPMPENSKLSFFLLFLGSVIPPSRDEDASADIMSKIRAHHQRLYEVSMSLGAKRYSYDTVTHGVTGENVWKEHLGQDSWEMLKLAKRKYDPYHILCPGINMW